MSVKNYWLELSILFDEHLYTRGIDFESDIANIWTQITRRPKEFFSPSICAKDADTSAVLVIGLTDKETGEYMNTTFNIMIDPKKIQYYLCHPNAIAHFLPHDETLPSTVTDIIFYNSDSKIGGPDNNDPATDTTIPSTAPIIYRRGTVRGITSVNGVTYLLVTYEIAGESLYSYPMVTYLQRIVDGKVDILQELHPVCQSELYPPGIPREPVVVYVPGIPTGTNGIDMTSLGDDLYLALNTIKQCTNPQSTAQTVLCRYNITTGTLTQLTYRRDDTDFGGIIGSFFRLQARYVYGEVMLYLLTIVKRQFQYGSEITQLRVSADVAEVIHVSTAFISGLTDAHTLAFQFAFIGNDLYMLTSYDDLYRGSAGAIIGPDTTIYRYSDYLVLNPTIINQYDVEVVRREEGIVAIAAGGSQLYYVKTGLNAYDLYDDGEIVATLPQYQGSLYTPISTPELPLILLEPVMTGGITHFYVSQTVRNTPIPPGNGYSDVRHRYSVLSHIALFDDQEFVYCGCDDMACKCA